MYLKYISLCLLIILTIINGDCDVDANLRANGIEVYVVGDPGYDTASFQYGSKSMSFSNEVAPTIIAYAASQSDAQLIVQFANGCDDVDEITIRSGGHQKSSLSSCNGNCLQLDVSQIKTFIMLDPDYGIDNSFNENIRNNPVFQRLTKRALIRVGAGLSYIELYVTLQQLGLNFIGGTCRGVYVGGNIQTSGHSAWSQAFGSGLDWVQSFNMVMADGTLLNVDPRLSDELYEIFRANLGGSPGAFGVVTDYDIEVFYDINFGRSSISYTYYPYSINTFESILIEFNQLIKDPSFRDNFDFGNAFVLVASIYDGLPPEIVELAVIAGTEHVVGIGVHYVGIQTGLPIFNNPVYTNYIVGRLRNAAYNPAFALNAPFDAPLPPSQRNLLFSTEWNYWDSGFASQLSSNDFSDEYYSEWANGINDLINDGYYMIATSYVAWGAAFKTNDPTNFYTSHPFRNTRIFVDTWNRVRPNSANFSTLVSTGQSRMNAIFDNTEQYLPNIDIGRKWTANTWGETDINLVWPDYYESWQDYIRLRIVKHKVDPFDLFNTPFTVDPLDPDNIPYPTTEPTEEPTEELPLP